AAGLTADGLKAGFVYFDAQTDDSRLTLAILRSAAALGAAVANYVAATGFATDGGRVTGAFVCETLLGEVGASGAAVNEVMSERRLIRAQHVVNATGVWAEETELLAGDGAQLRIAPSKGTHLVFAREALGLGDEAIVL